MSGHRKMGLDLPPENLLLILTPPSRCAIIQSPSDNQRRIIGNGRTRRVIGSSLHPVAVWPSRFCEELFEDHPANPHFRPPVSPDLLSPRGRDSAVSGCV